jgi:hypothetical protein
VGVHQREATVVDSFLILVAFAAATFSFSCAMAAFFQDRELLAATFGLGGVWLSVWLFARSNLGRAA